MSSYKDHNYPELMLDFEDKDIYEQNKDICICDKSLPLHYAIASQILHMTNEYIPIIKNYSCLYCYNQFHIEQKEDKTIPSIDEIKTILHSSPKHILEVKNKYGDTPLEIIFKILRILKFEYDNPYNKSYTDREIRYYIGILEDINEILKS
jgi:hypothetical protein